MRTATLGWRFEQSPYLEPARHLERLSAVGTDRASGNWATWVLRAESNSKKAKDHEKFRLRPNSRIPAGRPTLSQLVQPAQATASTSWGSASPSMPTHRAWRS